MPTTTNYGWTTPADTDLVKDGASAIRTLGNGVDTTVKNLNPETTLGDISYRSSTANTNTRLAIGTTGQILTVSGGVPTWATPAASTPTAAGCLLRLTSDQAVANDTSTYITFTTEDFDTDSYHDNTTNTSRITIPTGKGGKYLLFGSFFWDANGTGWRRIEIVKNRTTVLGVLYNDWSGIGQPNSQGLSIVADLVAGDYVEVQGRQTSGGSLNVRVYETASTIFGAILLGA